MRSKNAGGVLKDLRLFNIDIYKIKEGRHEYVFEVNDRFFPFFENSLIEKGNAKVDVLLEKTSSFIKMNFNISGTYELTCDRSLRNFEEVFKTGQHIIFKYGNENKEIDDEIYIITKDTQQINIAQLIYEFICLTIPMKKIHPELRGELSEVETGKIIYTSEEPENEQQAKEEDVDPRWLKLKELRDLNKQ